MTFITHIKKFYIKFREYFLFAPVYWILALISLRSKLIATPTWFNGTLVEAHKLLVNFEFRNNEQSRLLQFLIPEWISDIFGFSIEQSYMINRWTFVFLALLGFHIYCRKWFSTGWAAASSFFLAAILPLSYMNDLQESSALLMLVFLLILWSIRAQNHFAFALLMLLGAFTNETSLVLGFAWVIHSLKLKTLKEFILNSLKGLALSSPAFIATGIIRYINRNRPHLGDPKQWNFNMNGIWEALQAAPIDWIQTPYLFPFLIFGFLWIYAFAAIKTSTDRMILSGLSIIPFFILGHMITGIIYEVRQMIPLSFVIIPAAFLWIQKKMSPE